MKPGKFISRFCKPAWMAEDNEEHRKELMHKQKRQGRYFRTMVWLLASVFWLLTSGSSLLAATLTGTIVNTAGTPLSTNITFTPLSTPQVNGTNLVSSTINTVTSSANGGFTNVLNAGDYKVTVGAAARDSFIITVPTNSGTFQMNTLITSALAYNSSAAPAYEFKLNKGQTNGYASLNSNALVPPAQLGSGTAGTNSFLRGDGAWTTGLARLQDATNTFKALNPWQTDFEFGGIMTTNQVTIQASTQDGTWPSLNFSIYQFANASLHLDDLGETVLASSVPYWAPQGIYLGNGPTPKLTADGSGALLVDGAALTANDPAALHAANNLSDVSNAATARNNLGLGTAATQNLGTFARISLSLGDMANKGAAAQNVGAYYLPSYDYPTNEAPSYIGQPMRTQNGYVYYGTSTSPGGFTNGSYLNILGGLNVGNPLLMPYVPGGSAPFEIYINGNLGNQTNAQLGNGNLDLKNMNPWGYSGLTMAYVKRNPTNAAGPSVMVDPVAGTVFMGNSDSSEGVAGVGGYAIDPGFMFGVLCPFNLGAETNFNHLVEAYDSNTKKWHWPKLTANVSNPTNAANVDAMTLDTSNLGLYVRSNIYLRGTIYAGATSDYQQTYALTTSDGHINTQCIDQTQNLKINKVIPNFYTTANGVMFDVGNNNTGFYFPVSDSSLSIAIAGQYVGKLDTSSNLTLVGAITSGRTLSATNGYILPTNALSSWPSAAPAPGAAFFGNSNGTVYILTSLSGSTAWAATNKLAP